MPQMKMYIHANCHTHHAMYFTTRILGKFCKSNAVSSKVQAGLALQ